MCPTTTQAKVYEGVYASLAYLASHESKLKDERDGPSLVRWLARDDKDQSPDTILKAPLTMKTVLTPKNTVATFTIRLAGEAAIHDLPVKLMTHILNNHH